MASEVVATGSSSEGLTPAQQLMQQHDHHATVEDVVDEEDVAHPPPGATPKADIVDATAAPLSEKAAGKQKANGPAQKAASAQLNTASEEAFPALGPVKPRVQAPVAPAWGKKSTSMATNGLNGNSPAASGAAPPASLTGSRGPALPSMALPGKHKEQVAFYNSDLKAGKELKKPIPQIIHDINKRSKARLERRETPGGVVFEATGQAKDVRQALMDIANEVLAKVRMLPSSIPIPMLMLCSKPSSSPFLPQSVLSSSGVVVTKSRISAAVLAHEFRYQNRKFRMRMMKLTYLSKAML